MKHSEFDRRGRLARRSLCLAVLALVVVSCGSSGSGTSEEVTDPPAFFTQTATGGSLEGSTLTLTGVAPSVVAVLDRPLRTIERIPVADFADTFAARFGGVPPNAILTAVADDEEQVAVLTISDPTYNSATETLTFTAVSIGEGGATLSKFGLTTLTIDSGPATVEQSSVKIQITQGEAEASLDLSDARNRTVLVKLSSEGSLMIESEQQQLGGYMKIANETDAAIEATVTLEKDQSHDYRISRNGTLFLHP